MPFQSEKQRRYMHANLPRIAKRWERDYANGGIIALAQGGRIGFYKGSDRHEGTGGRTSSGMDMSGATNVGGTTGSGLGGGPHGGGEWSGPTYSPPKTKTFTGPNIHGEGIGSQTFDINKRTIALQDQYRQGASQRAHPFLSKVKSGIGNIFRGLGNKIFQGRGQYETQADWEKARQDRINKKRINRLRKTRDYGKYANNPQGWAGSDLSGRLTGLEKDVFGKDYVDYGRNRIQARDLKALRDKQALTGQLSAKDFINLDQSISASGYKPRGFMENLQSKYPGAKPARAVNPDLTKSMSWYNNPAGYNTGNLIERGILATQDPLGEKGIMRTYNTLGGDLTIGGALKGIQSGAYKNLPSNMQKKFQEHILDQIKEAGGFQTQEGKDIFEENFSMGAVDPTFQGGRLDIDESQLEVPEINYPTKFPKYENLWLSQGGRVRYGAGGLASLWPR